MAILELFEREENQQTKKRRNFLLVILAIVVVLGGVVAVSFLIAVKPDKAFAPNATSSYDETVSETIDRIGVETNSAVDDESALDFTVSELNQLLSRAKNDEERAEVYRLQGKSYENAGKIAEAVKAYEKGIELHVVDYDYMFYRSLFMLYEKSANTDLQIKYLKLMLAEPSEGNIGMQTERDYYLNKLNYLEQNHE
ncbi:MAG: hypothetical protein LBQ02_01300 [Candidatus Nomurabacteria bacterium]|jgi:tetratricopeptide (TPR) repeat protein|nr:hypothetical protein [Candidatus Nomurabacteria bacterium]